MYRLYKEVNVPHFLQKWGLFVIFFLTGMQYVPVMAQTTYNVTSTADGNATNQLRGAILAADAAAGPSIINVAAGTYTLTMGQIVFGSHAQNITINGAGALVTTISMNAATQDRFFLINTSGEIPGVQTTISGLTFSGGHLTSDIYGGGAIICGGPNNIVTINNCVFNNNTSAGGAGGGVNGGALQMNGGGTLSLSQCTFTNNTCPNGVGGALYYFLPNSINGNNLSGSLSITNCTFSNNSVTSSGSTGGAIAIGVQGMFPGTTSSISIQRNNFTNNHANVTNGSGGAISVTNSHSSTNTAFINYNRFVGNTATNNNTSALVMSDTQGSVDATNNWWGCNTGPAGCNDKAARLAGSSVGTLNTSTWLQLSTMASTATLCSASPNNTSLITAGFLKNSAGVNISSSNLSAFTNVPVAVTFSAVLGNLSGAQASIQSSGTATVNYTSNGTAGSGSVNAVVDNVPASDATAKASLTVNASPSVSLSSSSVFSCSGNSVALTVTATGSSLVYQWYKGSTALANGATGTGSIISGVTTATLNIQNAGPLDNATNYNVIVSNTCQTTSANISVAVSPPVLATTTTAVNVPVSSASPVINNESCVRIVKVMPSGGAPVGGNVSASVTFDPGQLSINGQPYVMRHYDIEPLTNAATATATLTLYFLQSEFDSYNAAMAGTINDLPTGPGDAVGRANLRITQYHGTGTAPGNYSGWTGAGPATLLINPGASNVVWNSTINAWEVTFNVTGFSGFYATGLINSALPIRLESFTGSWQGAEVLLNWLVSEETNLSHYEVEMSRDGIHYSTIRNITANNNRSYSFKYGMPPNGLNYYRLKMIDNDGKYAYSNVIAINVYNLLNNLQVSPNPFHNKLQVQVEASKRTNTVLILTDLGGKILQKQHAVFNQGTNIIVLGQLGALIKGTYLLQIVNDEMNKTVKVVKAE